MEDIQFTIKQLDGMVFDWGRTAREHISERSDIRAAALTKEQVDELALFNSIHPIEIIISNYLTIIKSLLYTKDSEIYGDKG